MIITHEMLEEKGACTYQLKLFKKLFPNGSPSDKADALKAAIEHASIFDWNWAAVALLSPTALKAYYEATATAWKTYNEAKATAWKTYDEAKAAAFVEELFSMDNVNGGGSDE